MTNTARAARALLAGFALASLLACFAPSGQAGTPDAPEIVDAADDQTLTPAGVQTGVDCVGSVVGCPTFSRADIRSVWIDNETADTFNVNILLGGVPGSPNAHSTRWQVSASFGGTAVVSTVSSSGGASPTAPAAGDNVAAVAVDGNTLIVTIAKAVYGAPATGDSLTDLFVTGNGMAPAPIPTTVLATDRAPDTGGVAYVFNGGATTGGNGTLDSDGDGLNDTTEIQQFGNVSAQNGTGDPDGDGLNNSAEFNLGTNATLADTDGDGLEDGEDSAPLDPNQPALTNTTDRDNDTLPDLWEREHFNNTAAQNATGDPDADGLNNSAEFQQGTDPNMADTDGDGHDDAEDGAPLDPDSTGHAHDAGPGARPELYSGAAMFAAAATFCLLGLARLL